MSVTLSKIIQGVQLPNAAAASPGLYACPANTKVQIKKLTFTNNDSSAHTVTIHIVASAGTAGVTNIITKAASIAAGATYEAFEVEGHVLQPTDFITAFADAASQVTCHGSGIVVV